MLYGDLSPILCRPFGEHSRAWLCYVGPYVTLAVFGYVGPLVILCLCYVCPLVTLAMFGYAMLALL